MKTYFFVDNDGTENVSNIPPTRHKEGFWVVEKHISSKHEETIIYDALTEIPRGTIKALFDKELTFNDPPILIEA